MLKTVEIVKNPSVESLLSLWAQRYAINLSSQDLGNLLSNNILLEAASSQGRALTAKKLKENVLNVNCQMAWIQTKTLYGYISNILDLSEARRITQFAFRVYKKLIEVYQKYPLEDFGNSTEQSQRDFEKSIGIPSIGELVYALEPTLLLFQEQHIVSKDWRSLGFLTTQLNFCNQLILKKLEPAERILITPYLKFVEEQVAMPWQRVCVAASKYKIGAVKLQLVEEMLPKSPEIARSAYNNLVELLPNQRSRRGLLNDKGITHSCIRDLNMFQAYFWLCFLEESIRPIEQELLPLCSMVVEAVNIKWELTEKWCEVLTMEILNQVTPEKKEILQPYLLQMREVFWQQRYSLGFIEETKLEEIITNLGSKSLF
ncbi:hypothetical protein [Brunnivagina elsteri]|uniref:Uncharacterized protein n=1 Tax=Brunnivagina elsteri CCALA 953 TaxID=987040 RepID=A0A2A2TGH3_9CYAN|nr:hypothetical protein [Calothrix elsteri]PAX52907.1 hypothetical protein CK510_16730 [Calothrix elsteri CCALA 953]